MAKQRAIPEKVLSEVLLRSKRRCCICYDEGSSKEAMRGAVAHLFPTGEPSTDPTENLVFLCEKHHAELDRGKLSMPELIERRHKLYVELEAAESKRPSDKKLMPWQRYEGKVIDLLRKQMMEQYGDHFSFSIAPRVESRSGLHREVNLLIEMGALGFRLEILVEIKYRTQRLMVSDVEGIGALFQDLGANKGIIVCNSGFSPDAITRAKSLGIGLMQIAADTEDSNAPVNVEIVFVA